MKTELIIPLKASRPSGNLGNAERRYYLVRKSPAHSRQLGPEVCERSV